MKREMTGDIEKAIAIEAGLRQAVDYAAQIAEKYYLEDPGDAAIAIARDVELLHDTAVRLLRSLKRLEREGDAEA